MKKALTIFAALFLAGCEKTDESLYQEYWDHPQDAQVNIMAMEKCLASARGPARTTFNDWDEAIEACTSFADDASRYCPDNEMADCLPQYRRTRADVRNALATPPTKGNQNDTDN